jgi:transposase
MANRKATARTAKEILACLYEKHMSQRSTSAVLGVDRTVIARILRLFKEAGLTWPLSGDVTDKNIESIIYPPAEVTNAGGEKIDFEKIYSSRQIKGSTLTVLHQEWADEVRGQNTMGYQQFCKLYRMYLRQMKISMRRVDEFGEFCYVDYSGLQPSYVDPIAMKKVDCQLFVGVLGGSKYTYCEATHSQRMEDWLGSHVRMFTFFGGAPRFMVPDNLKAGVTMAHKFFPLINESYKRLCDEYQTMVFPARSRKPKDKPAAEGGVLLAQRWILFRLRKQTFFSLDELNNAIASLLKQLNEKPFQKLQGSRFSRWLEHERPTLQKLPARPYKFAEWGKARAGADYVINVKGSFYSVPHQLRNQEVHYRLTDDAIEIIHDNVPVASHPRSHVAGSVLISPAHQPPNHRAVANWSEVDTIAWAETVGPSTLKFIRMHIGRSTNNLVAYRTTEGLRSLCKIYGKYRLEEVCTYATMNNIFSMATIREILSKKLDKLLTNDIQEKPTAKKQHKNIRGAEYYADILKKSEEPESNE